MSFPAEKLSADPVFFRAVIECINALIDVYRQNARIGSIFATQQRWLLSHLGFGLHLGMPDNEGTGLYAGRFIKAALKYDVSSRNTAVAFLQEMEAYRFLKPVTGGDGRTRRLEPTDTTWEYFGRWLYAHLSVLDSLDYGRRVEVLLVHREREAALEALIAPEIMINTGIRGAGTTFTLFNAANSGGAVMDYLMSRLLDSEVDGSHIVIGRVSLNEICKRFLISNTHLKRLFKQAEDLGSLGWHGDNKGELWLSSGFVDEFMRYQAAKFAIIDAAAQQLMQSLPPAPLSWNAGTVDNKTKA